MTPPPTFLLGGRDLEMLTIRELLDSEGVPYHDRELGWGAKASDYQSEIEHALAHDQPIALVELKLDDPFTDIGQDPRVTIVDHHGDRAGAEAPTSLHQVFALLDLPPNRWTRHFDLVAANDRGGPPGLIEFGATEVEAHSIRAADRAAQGVTEAEEHAAEEACRNPEYPLGPDLTVIRLPHARTATVADRLDSALGGPGYENLLIACPDELAFYGKGNLVMALAKAFPDGWYGGSLPKRGYWGGHVDLDEALECLGSSSRDGRWSRQVD